MTSYTIYYGILDKMHQRPKESFIYDLMYYMTIYRNDYNLMVFNGLSKIMKFESPSIYK
jgi:hypothetical protein